VNPTVGDLAGNRRLVEEAAAKAAAAGADLVVLPELVLTGYPPMDLLEREGFVRDQLRQLEALEAVSREIDVVLGAVLRADRERSPRWLNAAVLLSGGRRVAVQPKSLLPTYDVFDERRYFAPAPGREATIAPRTGTPLGLTVCEDVWVDAFAYDVDPVGDLVAAGAELVLNVSCSPWRSGKTAERRHIVGDLGRRHGVPIVYVNQLGGNDEIIFDGGSFVTGSDGRILAQLPLFEPALEVVDLEGEGHGLPALEVIEPDRIAQLESALVLGIRDYFRKQGLPPGAVIGLSGVSPSVSSMSFSCFLILACFVSMYGLLPRYFFNSRSGLRGIW